MTEQPKPPSILIAGIDVAQLIPILKTASTNVVLIVLIAVILWGYRAKDDAYIALASTYAGLSAQIITQSAKIESLDTQVTNMRIQIARITGTDVIIPTPLPVR